MRGVRAAFVGLRLVAALSVVAGSPAVAMDVPTIEHGFKPERAFLVSEIDHVRILNGGLEIAIPLGIRYPVGGAGLSYGFTLHYGSQLWSFTQRWDQQGGGIMRTRAFPDGGSNSGFGWRLSLGELWPFGVNEAAGISCSFCYVDSSGARHEFADRLHWPDSPTQSGKGFSTDGTFLRVGEGEGGWKLELPSGEVHIFNSSGVLTEMRDQFGGWVRVDLEPEGEPDSWKVYDSEGREHWIRFVAVPHYGMAVGSIELSAFGGGNTAEYQFTYDNGVSVPRSCLDDDPQTSASITLPLLTQVLLPDDSTYKMPVGSYYTAPDVTCPDSAARQGLLQKIELPTLGSVEWTWGPYFFPVPTDASPDTDHPPTWLSAVTGVYSRTLRNAAGGIEGTWNYVPALQLISPGTWEAVTSVQTPLGDRTDHFHHFGQSTSVNYGFPFTTAVTGAPDREDLFLSTRVYDCATGGTGCALKRSTFVKYATLEGEPTNPFEVNSRILAAGTRFHDDGNRWAATDWSSYDGLGHFRTETTSGNYASGNVRTVETNFNPGSNYPGTMILPGPTAPWVLGNYDRVDITESSVTARSEFCFESNGFLKRARTLKNGTSRHATDLLAVFTPSAAGHRAEERYYGGDTASNVPTGSLCSLTPPTTDVYQIRNELSEGVISSSRYYDGTTALPFYSLRRDIDQRTGLVSKSYDVSNLGTSYNYDAMGRLTWVKPDDVPVAGGDGWTEYIYTRATAAGALAKLKINRRDNDGSSSPAIMAESELKFDSFGRLTEEARRMPGASVWSSRETKYNALGLRASVSEWGSFAKKTTYDDYDAFGRPASITPPDATVPRITFSYSGNREAARTTKVATGIGPLDVIVESSSTTTEIYDRQGRLIQVKEPSGPGGAQVTTSYTYDVGNRLKQAQTVSGATQTRIFTYDHRGFLTSEQHPEKGLLGNGLVTYSGYDARGHATRKIDGPNDLTFVFDKAERLTLVRETGGAARTLKSFGYSGTTGSGLGKLVTAERFNYVSVPGPATGRVREAYDYSGRGGRVSARTTELFINTNPAPSDSWVQGFEYTPLGEVDLFDYPRCTAGNCMAASVAREVIYKFARGWLDEVEHPSGVNWATVDYHQNGTVSAVDHANGVTMFQGLDSNFMARPASISTSGVGGGMNWHSGDYVYDGSGNVVRIGDSEYLYDLVSRVKSANVTFTPAGFAPPVSPPSPDLFGLEHLFSDGFESGNTQAWTVPPGPTNGLQTFTYDAFGNLTDIVGNPGPPIGIDSQTNRVTAGVYDAAGNMTSWTIPEGGTNQYSYGPFNEVWRVATPGEEWVHVYSADDERILSWQVGGAQVNRWTLRGLDNRVLREYNHSRIGGPTFIERDNIYRGSGPLLAAATPSGDRHYHVDHLGTPRQITDATGAQVAFHTYWPYGEEATLPNQDAARYKFTGHERDFGDLNTPTDDHDHMHARMSNPRLGRFLSVDPIGGNARLPQSWNRYSYVRGNPIRFVDPNGMDGLEFTDYVGAMASAVGSTADRVGYLIAKPFLLIGSGILNDNPAQFLGGVALTAAAPIGRYGLAIKELAGGVLVSGTIGGITAAATTNGNNVEAFVSGFTLGLASPPVGGGPIMASFKGAISSAVTQGTVDGTVSLERTVAAGATNAVGAGWVRVVEGSGNLITPTLRTGLQKAFSTAWSLTPVTAAAESRKECSEQTNGVARCQ